MSKTSSRMGDKDKDDAEKPAKEKKEPKQSSKTIKRKKKATLSGIQKIPSGKST